MALQREALASLFEASHVSGARSLNLENGGTLERARSMANHASMRTTQLYARRSDKATLDDVERIRLG